MARLIVAVKSEYESRFFLVDVGDIEEHQDALEEAVLRHADEYADQSQTAGKDEPYVRGACAILDDTVRVYHWRYWLAGDLIGEVEPTTSDDRDAVVPFSMLGQEFR